MRVRRDKLAALDAEGIAPYAYAYARTHGTQEALAAFEALEAEARVGAGADPAAPPPAEAEGPAVRVAGRVVSWRGQGKTAFAHVADAGGRLQCYFRQDVVGDAAFARLKSLVDVGDLVGVEGPCFRTRAGEITVRAERFELLAKSLRPLPLGKEQVVDGAIVRHSGFADPEQRYRQRYADLAVHPGGAAARSSRARG
jgi:lysyl-tRNA synthetase class 2